MRAPLPSLRGGAAQCRQPYEETTMRRLLLACALALMSGLACAAVNLNTATKDELIALPGIGPAKAQAILDYRAQHGAFKRVEELKDVKGIGAKRFEALKSELTVTPPSVRTAAKADGKEARADAKGAAAKGEIKGHK
jgi:competence protein ComEA